MVKTALDAIQWIDVRIEQASVMARTGQLYWFLLPTGCRPHTQVAGAGQACKTRPLLVPPSCPSCWALGGACIVRGEAQVHKTTTGQSTRSRPNLTQSNMSLNLLSNQGRINFCSKSPKINGGCWIGDKVHVCRRTGSVWAEQEPGLRA